MNENTVTLEKQREHRKDGFKKTIFNEGLLKIKYRENCSYGDCLGVSETKSYPKLCKGVSGPNA